MIVKELKELLSSYSDHMEVMITDREGDLMEISRSANRVNIYNGRPTDRYLRIKSEEFVDDNFDEKEAVLMLSTY